MLHKSVVYRLLLKRIGGVDYDRHCQHHAALEYRPLRQRFHLVDGVNGGSPGTEAELVLMNIRANVHQMVRESSHEYTLEQLACLVQEANWSICRRRAGILSRFMEKY